MSNRFVCDGSYEKDLQEYSKNVMEIYGLASETSEREIICMADTGNTVAMKMYADMIFYKKILRKNYYLDAFILYLASAGIEIDDEGKWQVSPKAYPLAYFNIGYYLLNYHKNSFLQKCEKIDIIERMSEGERYSTAYELALACENYVKAPGAVNLLGRILKKAAEDESIYNAMSSFLQGETKIQCLEKSDEYFKRAAGEGYVYACNSLAVREADIIIELNEDIAQNEISEHIDKYINYLSLAADKYEPYAANRLGLFYRTGEIFGSCGKTVVRTHINNSLARDYFYKAVVYPDSNSAWAYLNLIKYFYKDYEQDIDMLNEHMEYIKVLNPDVYDIAIDL